MDEQRDGVPCVLGVRGVFQIAVIACDEQGLLRRVQRIKESVEELIEGREKVRGGRLDSFVSDLVGQEVLKKREAVGTR